MYFLIADTAKEQEQYALVFNKYVILPMNKYFMLSKTMKFYISSRHVCSHTRHIERISSNTETYYTAT